MSKPYSEMKPAARVKARKHGGDDAYSWAVFVDGRVRWNGMSRDEANWRKNSEIALLVAAQARQNAV